MPWTPRHTEQQVRDAVASARSLAEALRTLGLRPAGGNHRTLQRLIAKYGISVAHLDPKWALRRAPRGSATPLAEILVVDSTYHRGHLKDRLFEEGVKQRRCELCGLGDEWRGRPMSLILDHINGHPTDNRLENLRIVCPNCAATLDTHCGRKNRIDRQPRACLHCSKEFIPRYPTHRYCSQECGIHSKGSHEPRPDRRNVARPSHEQLLSDLETMSFVAVGRKYGVSDNAVRKWLRYYAREKWNAARRRRAALCHRPGMPAVIDVELPYRAPMDAEGVIAYLAVRAIRGVEEVVDGAYRRSVRLPRGAGILELAPGAGLVRARFQLDNAADEPAAVERSRVLFDLDADPQAVFDALRPDPLIGPLIHADPGRRVPGHVDPDEIAFRAVLGQQVSLAGAATLAGRLVADYGEPLRSPLGNVTHLFPSARSLARADPERLPMPASRRRALIGLAQALDEGRVVLGPAVDPAEARKRLLELPGIGPWTADYVTLRALRDADAFLASDLGVRRALERLGLDGSPANAAKLAENWRPYRAYALMHLWATLANP